MHTRLLTLLLALPLGCGGPSEPAAPRCGDGVIDADEACDDGAANDDTTADACRSDCALPACGDGVVDGGEACDDGGVLGGDGCDATCGVEAGSLEVEPNDIPDDATPIDADGYGSLAEGDVDCWSFSAPRCAAVRVSERAPCGSALTMALYGPDGARLAAGAPGADGCAVLDPADQPGARWIVEGDWVVCVEAVQGAPVPGYALDVSVEDAALLDAPTGTDLDGDGEPNSCDLDRDGDSVADDIDTCPEVSNGPGTVLALGAEGYVRTWIAAGPYTGDPSADTCRPADVARVGEDQPDFAPSVGDIASDAGAAEEIAWHPHLLTGDTFDLTADYAFVDAPREAYAMVYLWSDASRAARLAVGADDGVFAWWNGALVLDVASCQGVVADQFTAPVEIVAGWNALLLKVRDNGGGWGHTARLLAEDGTPLTDLRPGLDPEGAWIPDQADADGDGAGDICDD